MFYTVYQTTCLVNGKTYIGVHKTTNPNDSYLGSGSKFLKAIKKYGKENFEKEILFIFDNPRDMLDKERELVVVDREKTYNLHRGGEWEGVSYESSVEAARKGGLETWKRSMTDPGLKLLLERNLAKGSAQAVERIKFLRENDPKWEEEFLSRIKEAQKFGTIAAQSSQSLEKQKQTLSRIQHQSKEKNSQYGTCWVCKEGISLKVKRDDLEKFLEEGYERGRGSDFKLLMEKTLQNSRGSTRNYRWIHNEEEVKYVPSSQICVYLKQGCVLGR